MNKNTTIVIILMLVASVLLGYFTARGNTRAFGWRGGMMRNTMMGRNTQFLGGSRMMANIDRHFIEQMIPHHEGAIAMAQVALERGKHPEIISLAEGIIEAQEREIADMKSWYETWFGEQVPVTSQSMMPARQSLGDGGGGRSLVHMGSMSGNLDTLIASKDFDKEFIRQMIPHHEMAVMMATMLESGTEREEMKELAGNIVTSQSREIEMMKSWLKMW